MNKFYKENSYKICKNVVSVINIKKIHKELLKIGNNLDSANKFNDIDNMWNKFSHNNRSMGGLLYNAFKYMPSVSLIANSNLIKTSLKNICGIKNPAIIDINCRIDSKNEEKYLFDWHQDFWFSASSKNAVVAWIPITNLDSSKGGIEIIPVQQDKIKIYRTKPGNKYHSYADAFLLDDKIPTSKSKKISNIKLGSALFFSFSSLHKSLPIINDNQSRFTIQIRYADFNDKEFIQNKYKPRQISKEILNLNKT
jgi:hypothetical protein